MLRENGCRTHATSIIERIITVPFPPDEMLWLRQYRDGDSDRVRLRAYPGSAEKHGQLGGHSREHLREGRGPRDRQRHDCRDRVQ